MPREFVWRLLIYKWYNVPFMYSYAPPIYLLIILLTNTLGEKEEKKSYYERKMKQKIPVLLQNWILANEVSEKWYAQKKNCMKPHHYLLYV